MRDLVLLTISGAVLSSLLTLGLAYLVFERHTKARLRREIEEQVEEATARMRQVLEQEIDRAGEVIEERVRQGVLKAVTDLPSSEILRGTTQNVVRTGVDLMEAGLDTFLGGPARKRRR